MFDFEFNHGGNKVCTEIQGSLISVEYNLSNSFRIGLLRQPPYLSLVLFALKSDNPINLINLSLNLASL